MEEEENDNCSLFGCNGDPYKGLFISAVVMLGIGVYFLNKKKKGLGTKVGLGVVGYYLLDKYVINKEKIIS